MIPLTFFYDDYIDQPKLSEQKTHISIYSPPHKWGRNKYTSLVGAMESLNALSVKKNIVDVR